MPEVTINYYLVLGWLIVGLALVAFAARRIAPGRAALLWLASGLVAGAGSTVIFQYGGADRLAFMALAILDTLAIGCVTQSVRQSVNGSYSDPRLLMVSAFLILVSIVLIAFGIGSPQAWAVPFQVGSLLMLLDSQYVLWRSRKTVATVAIMVALLLHLATHMLRIPFFPSLLDGGAAYPSAASGWLNWLLLTTSSIYVPVVALAIIGREVNKVMTDHRNRSERDEMTNLLTRVPFERELQRTFGDGGVMILTDIDRFKRINDQFGHATGDEVIRLFSELLRDSGAIAARVGGEEFALAFPGKSLDIGGMHADKLRVMFRSLSHPGGEGARRLSASFGVATYGDGVTFSQAYSRADAALYRAKSFGRNQVVLHDAMLEQAERRREGPATAF